MSIPPVCTPRGGGPWYRLCLYPIGGPAQAVVMTNDSDSTPIGLLTGKIVFITGDDENLSVRPFVAVRHARGHFMRLDQVKGVVFIFQKLGGITDIGQNHITCINTIGIQDQGWF